MREECPKCKGSKQVRKKIYSEFYKREIVATVTCECAMKETMREYFQPIQEKIGVFSTEKKITYDKVDILKKCLLLHGSRAVVYKAVRHLLKKLCIEKGWEKIPRYCIVQDSEIWNLWWEKQGLARKREEWYSYDLVMFEIGNKTDEHSWLPKCMLEQLAAFLDRNCIVWVLYFGDKPFSKSMYSNKEFESFLKQLKVVSSEVTECR